MQVIYEPRGRAREYSPLALNLYTGFCDHFCTYCYCRTMPPFKFQKDKDFPIKPREGVLEKLAKDVKVCPKDTQVLLSFTGDPYCHANSVHNLTRQALVMLKDACIKTAILTKGGRRALADIDILKEMTRVKVGATMTFLDPERSKQFEPNAASPEDRIYMLKMLHASGIRTWVSLEPVLDPEQSLAIIDAVSPFVDFFKVGTTNHVELPKPIDWQEFACDAVKKLMATGREFYVKADLQKHLPSDIKKNVIPAKYLDQDYLPSL